MSWLSGVGSMLGGRPEIREPTDQLLKRLEESRIAEDRRRIVSSLLNNSSFDSVQRKTIGSSLPVLLQVFKVDRENADVVKETLEILVQIMSVGQNVPGSFKPLPPSSPEKANVEIFLKDQKNLAVLLDLLEEQESSVRFEVTQLIQVLLANNKSSLQSCMLAAPMGLGHLMDLLKDPREMIRNEALLILLELCKGSQEIQKIVVFEGAFDSLFAIIHEEGGTGGGIVVQDALQIINVLLQDNVSNQNYFRETSCISKLTSLLRLSSSDAWILTDDQINILLYTLKMVSLLVSGNNPSAHTNQAVMCKNNVLNLVLPLALGRINSTVTRITALYTLGDLLYGNKENCTLFSTIQIHVEDLVPVIVTPHNMAAIASNPKIQPALSRLLTVSLKMSEVRERIAACRVFKCYLSENEEGQLSLASTLTPPQLNDTHKSMDAASSESIGTQLIYYFISWEDDNEPYPFKCWFALSILTSILRDEPTSKELVLKIPLELPKSGVPMVTLLTKCTKNLMLSCRLSQNPTPTKEGQTPKPTDRFNLVKIGLLRLLATWLYSCPNAIKVLLSSANNLPFLVELILAVPTDEGDIHVQGLTCLLLGLCFKYGEEESGGQFNRSAIHSIIVQRIGLDKFNSKLDALRKSPQFVHAEAGEADENVALKVGSENYVKNFSSIQQTSQQISQIFYYDYDFTLFYKATADKIQKQLKSPKSFQNTPVKAKKTQEAPSKSSEASTSSTHIASVVSLPKTVESSSNSDAVLHSYKELIRHQDIELESWKARYKELEQSLKNAPTTSVVEKSVPSDEHLKLIEEQKKTIEGLKEEVESLQTQVEAKESSPSSEEFLGLTQAYQQLGAVLAEKEETIKRMSSSVSSPPSNASSASNEEVEKLKKDLEASQKLISELTVKVSEAERQAKVAKVQFDSLESEQDELLIELANLQSENSELRAKLGLN